MGPLVLSTAQCESDSNFQPKYRIQNDAKLTKLLIWSVCITVTLDWRLLYLPASWGLFYYHKEINFYVMTSFFIENY